MASSFKIGTLIEDRGKIGVIKNFIPKGTANRFFGFRDNYEIMFTDNTQYLIGVEAFNRLAEIGQIKIISTTPLPPPFEKDALFT